MNAIDQKISNAKAILAAPDIFAGVVTEWARDVLSKRGDRTEMFETRGSVIKVDDALGIVFGWAIICKEDGEDYFDTQDDHIPESSMLKSAADFMASSRVLGDMHEKAEGGNVVFAFPMTADIAAAFGMTTKVTGLMIGVKPANAAMLEKFKSGEYSGFSIGGRRVKDTEIS